MTLTLQPRPLPGALVSHEHILFSQTQEERDDLYRKFVKAIHEVQQKSSFKNLLLEKKLSALADTLEKKEAQLNEVLSASNLDPTALTVVTRKLEVKGKDVKSFFFFFFKDTKVIPKVVKNLQ